MATTGTSIGSDAGQAGVVVARPELADGSNRRVVARRDGGEVTGRTQTKDQTAAAEVTQLIVGQMRDMDKAPISATELDTRKAVSVGRVGHATETTEGITATLGHHVATGAPVTQMPLAIERPAAADGAQAKAAGTLLDPVRASLVIVGEAEAFTPALR